MPQKKKKIYVIVLQYLPSDSNISEEKSKLQATKLVNLQTRV